MDLRNFGQIDLPKASKALFESLNIPFNTFEDKSFDPQEVLEEFYNPNNEAQRLIDDIYITGLIDDSAFDEEEKLDVEEVKQKAKDYDGIMLFTVRLHSRENDLLPTRTQLADITRVFNRAYGSMPVVVIFRYDKYIAFANCERTEYKQEWREGEKAGKVSLLRDIDFNNVHTGHLLILRDLEIQRAGKNTVNSFEELYSKWQEVFNISILNTRFYKELQYWYFWAVSVVIFPNVPKRQDFSSDEKHIEAIKEHKGKNVIRLLTRILFIWFIKEKGLIPEKLFQPQFLVDDLLVDLVPEKEEGLLFREDTKSIYYKAVLQNLFFATLNQERKKRAFRNSKDKKQHRNITHLMRYESFFKNPQLFIDLVEDTVPFMNGGLFECLDVPHPTEKGRNGGAKIVRNDGFSDREDNPLLVPDFLFFDSDEVVDLSHEYGTNSSEYKSTKTRGLFKILKDYKFTIAENTPVEQEIALDPELLGKVFENLLASYNPETKVTARKQTGSFYTPRNIVNYMVDESLITYLKNTIHIPDSSEKDTFGLEKDLRELFSYSSINPFHDRPEITLKIIKALDACKILDPACGSGAYPMGILQKMVHVLHKIDPNNEQWKDRQIKKANTIEDSEIREKVIEDIEEAFENNELDYGRKLYLIENCIYGVDLQPIASQISRLRFFISLIVDQKVDKTKIDFGIRPLPNLETKFVSANTLLTVRKNYTLFDTDAVKALEDRLKENRKKIFSAKTPKTKRKYKKADKDYREALTEQLIKYGMPDATAEKLANWNPFDQNASADYFDLDWMFGISDGFDIVIGNPPYVSLQRMSDTKALKAANFKTFVRTGDLYSLFYEKGVELLKENGLLCYITSNKWINANYGKSTRKFLLDYSNPLVLIDFNKIKIFDTATVFVNILLTQKTINENKLNACAVEGTTMPDIELFDYFKDEKVSLANLDENVWKINKEITQGINNRIETVGLKLKYWKGINFKRGITTGYNKAFHIEKQIKDKLLSEDASSSDVIKPLLRGKDIKRWAYKHKDFYTLFIPWHFPLHDNPDVTGNSIVAEKAFKEKYPAVYGHLNNYKLELSSRNQAETGIRYEWYALQRYGADFYKEYEKEKIVWMEISDRGNYAYDSSGMYITNSAYFLSGDNLKYLLAVLNSKVADYYFFQVTAVIAGGRKRYTKQYVEQIPVPQISKEEQKPFEKIVDYILFLKSIEGDKRAKQMFNYFEQVLNTMVYELYFEEHVREKGLEIIKYISEVPEVFKDLVEVEAVYQKIHDKNHPIRNSIFFIDSIPEIKEISNVYQG